MIFFLSEFGVSMVLGKLEHYVVLKYANEQQFDMKKFQH